MHASTWWPRTERLISIPSRIRRTRARFPLQTPLRVWCKRVNPLQHHAIAANSLPSTFRSPYLSRPPRWSMAVYLQTAWRLEASQFMNLIIMMPAARRTSCLPPYLCTTIHTYSYIIFYLDARYVGAVTKKYRRCPAEMPSASKNVKTACARQIGTLLQSA